MTSQGHLPAEFAHACARGNYKQAVALAAQLKPPSLVEALDLLPLIADNEPRKYELAALRWHAGWQLQTRAADFATSMFALGAPAAVKSLRRPDALRWLRSLL